MGNSSGNGWLFCNDCGRKEEVLHEMKHEVRPVSQDETDFHLESVNKEEITEFLCVSGLFSPSSCDLQGEHLQENTETNPKSQFFSFELGGKLNWIEKGIIKSRFSVKNRHETAPVKDGFVFMGRNKKRSPTNLDAVHIQVSLNELMHKKNDQLLNRSNDNYMISPPKTPSLVGFSTTESPSRHQRSLSSNISEKSINLVDRLKSETSSNVNPNLSYESIIL